MQDLRRQSRSFKHTGAKVLDQNLRVFDQAAQNLAALVGLPIQRHQPLVSRQCFPPDTYTILGARAQNPQHVALPRSFDLDHLGTEIGEQRAAHRRGNHMPQFNHPEIAQRPVFYLHSVVSQIVISRSSSPNL